MTAAMPFAEAWDTLTARAREARAHQIAGSVLALVPHPDDETLGFGGLLHQLHALGTRVDVVLVTDGTGSHPNAVEFHPDRRREVREQELRLALERLGVPDLDVRFWRKPDAHLATLPDDERAACVDQLLALQREHAYASVLTPFRYDPHGDHRAITSWAMTARERLPPGQRPALWEYCVWLGHQGSAADVEAAAELPLLRIDVRAQRDAKREALQAHASQLGRVFDDPHGFVVPDSLAAVVERDYEYFFYTPAA